MTTPAPGWFNDPEIPDQLRWWDGNEWTTHTASTSPNATLAPPTEAQSGAGGKIQTKQKTALAVGVAVLVLALILAFVPGLLVIVGLALIAVSIYVFVRGSAPRLRLPSRLAGLAALGIAFALIFGGSAASARLNPAGTSDVEAARSESRATISTPTPEPIPTTFDEVQVTTAIPFERTAVDNPHLDAGITAISTAGVDGSKLTTYRVKYIDGVEVAREVVSEVVASNPVAEVTSNGTRQPAPAAPVPLAAPSTCHRSYAGACVPIASDVDCEGGSGNGPAFVRGPLQVVGPDVYDLERDGDGIACD